MVAICRIIDRNFGSISGSNWKSRISHLRFQVVRCKNADTWDSNDGYLILVEAKGAQEPLREAEHSRNLFLGLFWCAVDVSIVLREASYAKQAVERSRRLIPGSNTTCKHTSAVYLRPQPADTQYAHR